MASRNLTAHLSDPDSPACSDADYRGEGRYDDPIFYCDKCGEETSQLFEVQTARMTMGSPAEYEQWCAQCCETGPDWNDREPTEDELEARRRRRR